MAVFLAVLFPEIEEGGIWLKGCYLPTLKSNGSPIVISKIEKQHLKDQGMACVNPSSRVALGKRGGPSPRARTLASVLRSAPPLSTQEREAHSSAAPSQVDIREKQYYDCILSIQIGLVVLVQK